MIYNIKSVYNVNNITIYMCSKVRYLKSFSMIQNRSQLKCISWSLLLHICEGIASSLIVYPVDPANGQTNFA